MAVSAVDVVGMSDRERTRLRGTAIGFVFQTFDPMPKFAADENVALPMVFQGVPSSERAERARMLLERVGLGDCADHRTPEPAF